MPLGADTPKAVVAAVAQGARRLLCLPAQMSFPARMLIHAPEAARRGDLLALVSSVMRHLPVEATAVTLRRPEANRSEVVEAQRILLDTRADLRGAHGLDLRGDLFVGGLEAWFAELAAQPDPVLIVLGLPHSQQALSAALSGDYAALFNADSHAAVLLAIDGAP